MTQWHGYILIENLGLTSLQRSTLIDGLKKLGPSNDSQPARLNHWRIRTDNEAVIFEAAFDSGNISIQAIKNRLASIFGVDSNTITHIANVGVYGPEITFSRAGDKLFMIEFGGNMANWQTSHQAAVVYLQDNIGDWE